MRDAAAVLYDAAFGEKFAVAVRSREARLKLMAASFRLEFGISAVRRGELVGLAGFHCDDGALTGGMDYRGVIRQLGILRGNWAAAIFSLYERETSDGELLMDGIAVREDARGLGIGTRLLEELERYAAESGYRRIRLDVIDTNPAARRMYERNGFRATKTERFGYLRWLLGFGAATTMVREVGAELGTEDDDG